MTRMEHERIVAEQRRELARSDAEMRRLLIEAQQWVDRLRRVTLDIREGNREDADRRRQT